MSFPYLPFPSGRGNPSPGPRLSYISIGIYVVSCLCQSLLSIIHNYSSSGKFSVSFSTVWIAWTLCFQIKPYSRDCCSSYRISAAISFCSASSTFLASLSFMGTSFPAATLFLSLSGICSITELFAKEKFFLFSLFFFTFFCGHSIRSPFVFYNNTENMQSSFAIFVCTQKTGKRFPVLFSPPFTLVLKRFARRVFLSFRTNFLLLTFL